MSINMETSWMIVIVTDAILDNGEMSENVYHVTASNVEDAMRIAAEHLHNVDVRYGHIVDIHIERD